MADIRINALATTATTPASDDYLALDGSANGTRKILATNIANNVTDVILGSSGPSVKSTLSARAPRQGLVFDGTAVTATATLASVIGAGDASIELRVKLRENSSSLSQVFTVGSVASDPNSVNGIRITRETGGFLRVLMFGATTNDYRYADYDVASYASKWVHIVWSQSSGTPTLYVNGVVVSSYNSGTGGTAPSWSAFGSARYVTLSSGVDTLNGSYIYNRALSSSEVVALYEAGAPAGADYNNASNTAINTVAFGTNAYWPLYSTFSSTATSFSAQDASGARACQSNSAFPVTVGQKILITFTFTQNGSDTPQIILNGAVDGSDCSNPVYPVAGSNSFILTATASKSVIIRFFSNNASNYSISNFSATRIGLLLAPDAQQPGSGTIWKDTSGNAANITLPGSGVTWNVPSVFYQQGNCTGLTVESSTGTITSYTVWQAYYTKIGRQVTINAFIEITNNGTGGGRLDLKNLPFTSAAYASGATREGGTHGQTCSMIMNESTTTINMYRYDNTYPAATGSNFPITFTYIAAN